MRSFPRKIIADKIVADVSLAKKSYEEIKRQTKAELSFFKTLSSQQFAVEFNN